MALFETNRVDRTIPESGIVGVGMVLVIVGLLFRDAFGLTSLLLAVGLGLVLAGTVYVATEGSEPVRLGLTFLSLVAVQLVAFGGVVRWIGGVAIGAIVLAIVVTRT